MRNVWKTSKREISIGGRPLVMAILNVTPDSFSDGGEFLSVADALAQAEKLIRDGADIIDIGGESTRPGGEPVSAEDEISRVVPVVEALTKNFDFPISVDTTKSMVAARAIDAGAEIINDISGLRWDPELADLANNTGAGLVLMHSRGGPQNMHKQDPVADIMDDVSDGLHRSVSAAVGRGVSPEQIVLDVGLGFGKTFDQNLELLANLDKIVSEFSDFPMLVGASRKSFIGKVLGDAPVKGRLGGSVAAALVAVAGGASIVRVHDVFETVQALRVTEAIKAGRKEGH